tara:strand:+ start:20158 stop:20709 length:552 start_codon:yes stop_codon:yes gene_type:complete
MISVLVSCASPTKFNEYEEGAWDIRAMIRDKRAAKSALVNVDAVARKPDQLRMDFSTSIGMELGYFILNRDKVSYYLAKTNKKRQVNASPRAMRPLIHTDLDPYLLVKILFDEEPKGKHWQCERDEKGFLSKCNNSNKKISLQWLKRKSQQRAIEVETPSARIQLSLKGFRSKVETSADTFQI